MRLPAETATPPGQWRRLYLARGTNDSSVTLEPTAHAGAVDPLIANAFLQPDLFLVYDNWAGHSIGLDGKLGVGGFSFTWASPDAMLVAKFNAQISLQHLFALPERWRDSKTLVKDVDAAKKAFDHVVEVAQAARQADLTLFDDFLDRIVSDPSWTGLVVFNAAVDGGAMPAALQILLAGLSGTLKAHHLAVDVTALESTHGVPREQGLSSTAGVIYYANAAGAPPASGDFGFYTKSLQVGIFGSALTSFSAEVGVTVNTLFGRAVALRDPENRKRANTFSLKGVYQVIADVPTISFQLPVRRVFDFPVDPGLEGGGLYRVLERFEVDSAGISPQSTKQISEGTIEHQAQITLSGELWFAVDPFGAGVDLFSYGVAGQGLRLSNFGLHVTFKLDSSSKSVGPPTIKPDYSRLGVAAPADAARSDSLVKGLPFKLKGILADDQGLDLGKLGGKPVQILPIAAQQIQRPRFVLQFDLNIGSLGELSGVHAALTAEMRLGWGPLETTPDADGAVMTVQLPGASGGFKDFNVQGMLQLVFGDANLLPVTYGEAATVYAILFNNVALSVMGVKLPPKVISDLILFSDPRNATESNLAACLAVRQQ